MAKLTFRVALPKDSPYFIKGFLELRVSFEDKEGHAYSGLKGTEFILRPGDHVRAGNSRALAVLQAQRDDDGRPFFEKVDGAGIPDPLDLDDFLSHFFQDG
ncbi:MAG: hypothetical protein GWN84_20670 [Gammaproteobacteria bacterium]|nr:hypothetical protein [Gammaproteobacteria bacterium]NIR85175.1 hypothetical protein [Gammaproteobacteria bacterium]NIU06224.1 hypothetical protein [Gammaproteobacteria bacterium]NIX87497.1 hypothetical protein [Gammaproteobacteria bacterium]